LSGSVLYIQDDLEVASDDFEFVLYDVENVLAPRLAPIAVKPRLTRHKTVLRVTDQPITIGLDLLDASELKVVIVVDSVLMKNVETDSSQPAIIEFVFLNFQTPKTSVYF